MYGRDMGACQDAKLMYVHTIMYVVQFVVHCNADLSRVHKVTQGHACIASLYFANGEN